MRIRSLLTVTALAGGLFAASSGVAIAAPDSVSEQSESCTLTVTDLYYSIAMLTASAKLEGGCSGTIGMVLERADTPDGPFQEEPDSTDYVQQAPDGTAALAYFTNPAERGYCRAKATFQTLTAVSENAVHC